MFSYWCWGFCLFFFRTTELIDRLKSLAASSKSACVCVFYGQQLSAVSLVYFSGGHQARKTVCLQPKELRTLGNIFHRYSGAEGSRQAGCATPETSTEVRTWAPLSACICYILRAIHGGLIILGFYCIKAMWQFYQDNVKNIGVSLWKAERLSVP